MGNRLKVLRVCLLSLAIVLVAGVAIAFADDSVTKVTDALGIKLPAWLQTAIVSGGGTAAVVWAFMKKKVEKAIVLYGDLRMIIHEFVESATMLKEVTLEPDKRKQWNEQLDSIIKLCNDTEQKQMMQIAQHLMTKKVAV